MVQVDSTNNIYNVQATSVNQSTRVSSSTKTSNNAVDTSNNQAEYWANLAENYANLAQQSSENAEKSASIVAQTIQEQENSSIENVQNTASSALNDLENKYEELKNALATTYIHEQVEATDVWIINHNLHKKPSITIVDSSDNVVEGEEKYVDDDTVEIYFKGSFKGKAYLN